MQAVASGLLTLFSPAEAVPGGATLSRAARRLASWGFAVQVDEAARARHRGLAGDATLRLAALHRTADAAPAVAMATQAGSGVTALLDGVDWLRMARSVERGTRWVGHGGFAALQLALLAHGGAQAWAGPMALPDFGRDDAAGGVDEVTRDCFVEAMDGSLEAVGFRTAAGLDGLSRRGRLWGGPLAVVVSLLGTRHWPRRCVRGGLLFVDVDGEPAARVEALWLQLRQAGVLEQQQAVLLGAHVAAAAPVRRPGWPRPLLARLREGLATPVLPGLPFGAVHPKVTLPLGARVRLEVAGRDALLHW